ncbi:carbon-nitrogen hydrolase family protein [Microlunatus panaciterrae]|uniref:Amidohydrolase n=1 Tax=Microlunatus panaciterrae TaxID=400768 RepID=A0ABS2RH40_9ACTN|nr:carbon-nitrogen hydrolase family protein [Microlunatus panaciterrae]MBM7797506.1 putative amidohydrolase [Microlunatus panaciterrae]
MRVALAQIVSTADPVANLALVAEQTAVAAGQGAELVIFPEATMRCFGGPLRGVAEPLDGPWAGRLRAIADRHQVTVVAGMFTPGSEGRVTNTLVAYGPQVDAHYDKIHLFDAFGFAESDTVQPGQAPVLIDVGGVRVGLTTCYDVRFPGLFTALADAGAELICVCASWGAGPGKVEQWNLLARARALDSTTFVAACGQADPETVGDHRTGTAPTGVGHSMVIAPDGAVLAELGAAPGLLVIDIDPARVAEVRRMLPVLANRRY